jgi:hypothetical protein
MADYRKLVEPRVLDFSYHETAGPQMGTPR